MFIKIKGLYSLLIKYFTASTCKLFARVQQLYYNTLDMILCRDKSNSHQEEESFHQQTGLNFRNKLIKGYIWGAALCGSVTWTLRKVDQKCLESSEIWCWRKMEKNSWVKCVRNEV
jgi:hypothetical protein